MSKTKLRQLAAYVAERIDEIDARVRSAYYYIETMRLPLRLADESLYSEIEEHIQDWCEDNGEDFEDIEVEDVFDNL